MPVLTFSHTCCNANINSATYVRHVILAYSTYVVEANSLLCFALGHDNGILVW